MTFKINDGGVSLYYLFIPLFTIIGGILFAQPFEYSVVEFYNKSVELYSQWLRPLLIALLVLTTSFIALKSRKKIVFELLFGFGIFALLAPISYGFIVAFPANIGMSYLFIVVGSHSAIASIGLYFAALVWANFSVDKNHLKHRVNLTKETP